jgi:predicted nuclease of predicted toxin-antitoxin system
MPSHVTSSLTNLPAWRFFLDEQIDFRLKRDLRAAGFIADHVHALDVGLGGLPDTVILGFARSNHCILITMDTDFLNVALHPPPHEGILSAANLLSRLPHNCCNSKWTRNGKQMLILQLDGSNTLTVMKTSKPLSNGI